MSALNPTAIVEAAGFWSYAVVFLLTAAETSAFFGVFMPGESLILVAGALAGRGDLDPVALAAVVVCAAILGDSAGYALGRWYERRPGGGRMRQRTARARDFLQRRGGPAVFAGRFIGFVRSFLPFAAGGAGLPYRRFLPYSAVAAVLWGVGNVAAGYYLGPSVEQLIRTVGAVGAAVVAAVVLVVVFVLPLLRRRSVPTVVQDEPGLAGAGLDDAGLHGAGLDAAARDGWVAGTQSLTGSPAGVRWSRGRPDGPGAPPYGRRAAVGSAAPAATQQPAHPSRGAGRVRSSAAAGTGRRKACR